MPQPAQDARLEGAMARFARFFEELRESFVERDEVLTQFALALLCRQHVLITGPPGTAKSQMAAVVLGRIVDEDTGEPSVFSRQFTESTVQTDLVGPLDFKTLMDTGRTEHFTEEGMLGSVHAFLDEVFDGRDMLLRSTLNILHERELKQGASVTRGRIESAFMTSNRYISEILDSSRDTLLAFIDRVSFISFVPRGFAAPESLGLVVRRHGAGLGRHVLQARLTVQDLDLLQAATDATYVAEEICDSVARLVGALDQELAEARRMDPGFQPTRYLSTRTAVQAANVLRAVAFHDRIFRDRRRDPQVRFEDLDGLRYNLLLVGLRPDDIGRRMEQETDPRERRQLDIMRTEAEIFSRCLARLPHVVVPARPPNVELVRLQEVAQKARNTDDSAVLQGAVRELVHAAESGAPDADRAAQLLVSAVEKLTEQALRVGLTPGLTTPEAVTSTCDELRSLAENIEDASAESRPTARWLRGRLVQLVDQGLLLAPSASQESLEVLLMAENDDAIDRQIAARLAAMESTHALRSELLSNGTWLGEPGRSKEPWTVALGKLEDELVLLFDARLCRMAGEMLSRAESQPLPEVLRELAPFIRTLETVAERYGALGGISRLDERVIGPRLDPLIEHALRRLDGANRVEAVQTVERVVAELTSAGLGAIVTPARFVAWMVPPLVRDHPVSPPATSIETKAEYDAAALREPSLSVTETLQQIAILTAGVDAHRPDQPVANAEAISEVLRSLDAADQQEILGLDLARIDRGIARLESWWARLAESELDAEDPARPVAMLERVVRSGFLRVVRGDAAPFRLALEASRIAEVFPSWLPRSEAFRRRVEALDAESTRLLVGLLEARSDRLWKEVLAPEKGT